ncbi:hypothetical protein BC936DRAFT_140951 [Jimgerdemannia flammicorona]|uniref:phosphoethanolamine N-methyltransferase n=1 Tax=Jimgerdemannia flammicorona TaxID=994334 RepID=A0A433DGE8_9FUNG|nr:hypothetical protein BC936DRAFT_140951 [Jimgerdemannia flammicorona]
MRTIPRSLRLTATLSFLFTYPILFFTTSHLTSLLYGFVLATILAYYVPVLSEILHHHLGLSPAENNPNEPAESDMYGLNHALLNLHVPPQTWWFNVGLWGRDGMTFEEACRALVNKVAEAAGVKEGGRVLDVGFGCGDSCFLLAERYGCYVTGITNETTQHTLATSRLTTRSPTHPGPRPRLLLGDASNLASTPNLLPPASPLFDAILSIDSAYHYNTRWSFLASALPILRPSGSVALADVALHPVAVPTTPWRRWALRAVCAMGRIPFENMVTRAEYEARMRTIGFVDVKFEVVPPEKVFGGLAEFIKRQRQKCEEVGVRTAPVTSVGLAVVEWMCGWFRGGEVCEFVIVSGRKADK